jgi:hypothetical protein
MKTLQTLRRTCSKLVVTGAALALPWLATTAQAQSTLANGLVAQWGFDGNFLDGVKNFHGEGRGTTPPVFEAGKAGFGQAVKLDGGNQFVEITGGNENELEFPGGSMSIAAWFKVGTFDTEWQALIAKGEGNNYRIARRGTTGAIAYAGGVGEPGQAAPDVNDGAWHHVVAVSDHTAGTYLYIDGVLVEENTTPPVLASNAQNLMIGENPDARNREWEGSIDDVGIWNRVLTEAEVKEIWNNGTGKALINILPAKTEILGTGAASLLGRDLTDPENNGVDALGAGADPAANGWNWASISSSHEPDFEGGENSFNIFDNKVGGGNDKWCCDDPTEENPVWVAVEFAQPVSLSRFTVTSGNDSPDRDPTDWAIQGSNDGNTWEDVYRFKGTPALWTARNQVIKFTLPVAAKPFKHLRYICWATPGTLHQLNEVEFFSGTVGYISGVNGGLKTFSFFANDLGSSIIDPATATLTLDGAAAPLVATDTATGASFVHTYAAPLIPGSTHTYKIAVKDTSGATINSDGSFTLGLPVFPTANLPALPVTKSQWNIRHIFGAGTITDFATSFAAITNVGKADFAGVSVDGNTQVINYPAGGGFFGNGLPYPDEVTGDGAWTGEDFVQFSVGHIEIPEAGEYTFGVHSDDGFAFRIRGGEAIKVSGNGSLDPVDPEAVLHPANTGDSNTRAVFKLKKGVYRVEFFWWERGGGDNGEFYAAKGNWTNDADTSNWMLVGDTIVSQTFQKLGVDENGWTVIASDAGGDPLNTLADATADLTATGGGSKKYDTLNVGDPDSNAGVAAWPKDVAGVAEDDFAAKATAMLVVPVTGTYEIGFTGDDGGWMKITGATFTEIVQNATGLSVIEGTDTVSCDCLTGSSMTTVKVNLTAGKYPIEVGFFERGGGAFFRAFGAQFGSPQLPTLAKNGAGSFQTPEAIHLTTKPVGVIEENVTISIARSASGATITYTGTLQSASSPLGPWTDVAGATSPYATTTTAAQAYFRSRN